MTKLFMTALLLAVSVPAIAGPWHREFQDINLPSQEVLENYSWAAPAASSANNVLNASALTNGSATTVTTFLLQPDFARNLTITPTGTTANVGAGTAIVTGTNIYGKTITENFPIAAAQSYAETGAKAFKSITSIVFPAATGSGATFRVGFGTRLGLIRCAQDAGAYSWSVFNAAFETTRGTFTANPTTIDYNTFIPNGTMDAVKNVQLFYVQNFVCYPN